MPFQGYGIIDYIYFPTHQPLSIRDWSDNYIIYKGAYNYYRHVEFIDKELYTSKSDDSLHVARLNNNELLGSYWYRKTDISEFKIFKYDGDTLVEIKNIEAPGTYSLVSITNNVVIGYNVNEMVLFMR